MGSRFRGNDDFASGDRRAQRRADAAVERIVFDRTLQALRHGADDSGADSGAARLRAVLRRTRAERVRGSRNRKQARFEGWTVDFTRREVSAPDERKVHLTAAEFALLGVFLDHARIIIPRKRLMELAGVRDTPSSDRSIDVLVSRLRRKLGGQGRRAPIVTVRGAGYMFSAVVDRG